MPEQTKTAEPVHLLEDAQTGDRILVYSSERGVQVELKYEGDTLWMSQAQMAALFGIDRTVVTKHLSNIFDDGELNRDQVCAKNAHTAADGKTYEIQIYNLDAIISVGYRVSSAQGTLFRRWATEKLVQFATRGFVIDVPGLRRPDAHDRIRELREIIRDLRSDEANLYREIRTICSMCSDYDGKSEGAKEFYAHMQAKVMWSVTAHTPAELVISRANADHTNMGLRTWAGDAVKKGDITISKNYLAEPEIKELNRLTGILLDVLEDQVERGRLTTMGELDAALNAQLEGLGRHILTGGGRVKRAVADQHAAEQYRIFDDKRRAIRHAQADAAMAALKGVDKKLPKGKKKS